MNKTKTYAGIPEKYGKLENSKIVLISVPFDATSTWQKGADKGFEAFLDASENMELYDIETNSEVYKNGVFIDESIQEKLSPEKMVEQIHQIVKKYIIKDKFVTIFGGEHSISIGTIRAFKDCFKSLSVLHLDAHADLRDKYKGTQFNHACAVYEASKTTNLIQVGIRSMDICEKEVMNNNKVFFAEDIFYDESWQDQATELLSDNVFITLDVDVFDPSIMPSTGTPEPGGLFWNETISFLKKVFFEKNVVGFDIVELCPNPNNKAPDFMVAKLYYKMLSYKFIQDNEQ
ncbi:MAG: agmatinase [Flavobacteriaceae bacterium]|nr:agmatinase [Flavobacteriaceae bacterium]MBL6678604.1 agmatinase [Flavobacteriaceae bacterium]